MRTLSSVVALSLAVSSASFAQVTTVDEGSFTITRGGTLPANRIGQESFTIRRTRGPGGDVVVANATVTFDTEHIAPALRTDTSFSPLAYQVEVRTGTDVERLRGRIGGGRFSAQLKTAKGESSKEYIVSDGALILDDDVFHQYYFLVQRARGGSATIPVVIPRRNTQETMRIQPGANEQVRVGTSSVEARHYTIQEPTGATRQVWADAQGRILKVQLDGGNITATRDELPR
ncbi:MAG TPA: DUF6134 family protein [Gemmatimonadaceae bacterium]|jgi:hypothetical protein|nr:DUF6134 family protein [Gemmatimonadaceae bacterium]